MNEQNPSDLFNLSGKTAIITGASGGLGAGFARVLSKAGARVILTSRRLDRLETLAAQLGNAIAVNMDVSEKRNVMETLAVLEGQGERIDICVNNAGITGATAVFDENDDDVFERIIQTNLMGVWYMTKAAAGHMKRHAINGSIINIASVNGGNKLGPQRAAYCASKAAVMQFTKALVGELAPHHIRINCISPGLHNTPMTAVRVQANGKELKQAIPLGFIANPSDLYGALLYLASNKASRYVTGSVITVDGGISWGG